MTRAKKRLQWKVWLGVTIGLLLAAAPLRAVTLTTVEGTMYRADGSVASGTLLLSWPAFTTAENEAVAAGNLTVAVAANGWVQVNLAPNAGATPAGTYYTAVLHLADGTTSREYWVVPAGATANVGSVRAQLVPATVAIQTVSKQYVDTAIASVGTAFVPTAGGAMAGPLTLAGDPSTDMQAATKHYADSLVGPATSAAAAAQATASGAQGAAQSAQSKAAAAQAAAAAAVRKTGDAMTGPLVLAGDPSSSLQAATKQYVDAHAGGNNVDAGAYGQVPAYNVAGTNQHIGPTPEFVALGSLQSAVTAAAAVGGTVKIPANYTGTDTFTNPNGIPVVDLRTDVPVNARSVKEFGARCDGVTDDTAAIQAAFDYSAAHGYSSTSFPSGNCITGTLKYTGQPFFGVSETRSIITGKDGQDVFASPDPADGDNSCCAQSSRVHDITIVVNTQTAGLVTTSAWAAKGRAAGQGSVFANKIAAWSGQTVMGAVLATDTTIPLTTAVDLTNYHLGYAPWGWVKIGTEYLHYWGIENTGCPNSAPMCLKHVQRGITIAGTATTAAAYSGGQAVTPINALNPADVIDPLPAFLVGNCGFAFQNRDGASYNQFFYPKFDHVTITRTGLTNANGYNTCGFLFQKVPYDMQMDHITIPIGAGLAHGILFAPPSVHIDTPLSQSISSDGNKYSNLTIAGPVPFLTWIGAKMSMVDSDFYMNSAVDQQAVGLTFHPVTCPVGSYCAGQSIAPIAGNLDNVTTEANNGLLMPQDQYSPYAQMYNISISGGSALRGAGHGGTAVYGNFGPFIMEGDNTTVETDTSPCGGTLWYGNANHVTLDASCVNSDYGLGNVFVTKRPSSTTYTRENITPARDLVNRATPDLLLGANQPIGDGQWFGSMSDLFITPERTQTSLGVTYPFTSLGTKVVPDSAAPVTQKAAFIPASSGSGILFWIDGTPLNASALKVGTIFPRTTGTLHMTAKSSIATTLNLRVMVNYPDNSSYTAGQAACSLTTTYADCTVPYDASGGGGGFISIDSYGSNGPNGSYSPNPSADLYVAWFGFSPTLGSLNAKQMNASGYQVNGTALASAHLSDGATLARLNGANTWSGAQSFGAVSAQSLALGGDPSSPLQAATKQYVDARTSNIAESQVSSLLSDMAGKQAVLPGVTSDGSNGIAVAGTVAAATIAGAQIVGHGANVDLATTITNAAVSGGSVYVPAGTYLLSAPINLSNIEIFGDTEKTVIAQGAGYTSQALLNLGSNVHLHHITISAPTAVSGGNTIIAANANASHVEIDHVRITGSSGSQGVAMNVAGVNDWNIHDNVFSTHSYGVLLNGNAMDARNIKIAHNDFSSIYGDAVELNNPISSVGGTPYTAAWNIVVEGNTINATLGSGPYSGFGVGIAGSDYVSVAGNIITSRLEAIHVEDSASTINISNNLVSSTQNDACIEVIGGMNISVTNNVLRNCSTAAPGWGISLVDPPNASPGKWTVVGNQVDNTNGVGIFISTHNVTGTYASPSSGIVANNYVQGSTGDGIGIADAPQGVDVHGNSLVNNGGCGINIVRSGVWSTYEGNTFQGNSSACPDYQFPASGAVAHVEDVKELFVNAATVAAGSTGNVSSLSLQNTAEGDLTVRAVANGAGYYAQRSYHVRWNGTTFESVAISEKNANGPLDINSLSYSGGVVRIPIYNADTYTHTFNVDVTFVGSIQGGTGGGTNVVTQPADYVTISDPSATCNLSALQRGRACRYTLASGEAGSVSAITNGLIGETYYFEICQGPAGGGTVGWPSNVQGFPPAYGMAAGSCLRFPFSYDGTNYIGPFYSLSQLPNLTIPNPGLLKTYSFQYADGSAATYTNPLQGEGTTGSAGGSALAEGACASSSVAVSGATSSMVVQCTPATYPGDGFWWGGYVASPGYVTVKVCAFVAGTPAASTYRCTVNK